MSEPRKRLKTQTKSAYAAERIREALARGRYASGEWLRAQELADELGLSLTPVREALLELASQGMINMVPFRGARVAEIPLIDLSEVYAARGLLESAAAGLAAARFTSKGLSNLAALQAEFVKAAKDGKTEELRDLNDRFHFAIYDAADAPLIRQLIKQVWAHAPRDTFRLLPERPDRTVQEHACILNALRSRDPREAERAMRHHIDEAFELIRDYRSEPAHIKQARRGTPLKPLTRKPARNV